jgi:hypothetical protein
MTSPHPRLPHRHGWLRHLVKGLEDDPHVQYRVHLRAVQVWLASMVAVSLVFFLDQPLWIRVSVFYLVLISLYANLATDYGSMSASMAAFAPGEHLPEIPMESTQAVAHYAESAQTRALLEQNTALTQQVHDLTRQIATQTATLEEIHRHVTALAPQAGAFPPAAPAPGKPPRGRKAST